MRDLREKVAFITGGAGGIGLGMAKAFAGQGMRLVIADISDQALGLAASQLTAEGASVLPIRMDVSDGASWTAAVDQAWSRFGAIDVLCNNAGVGIAGRTAAEQFGIVTTPEALWRVVFETNVTGLFLGLTRVAPRMIERGLPGHIVNTASMAGLIAPPSMGTYAASKYAVVGLSEALRGELAPHRIGVSILCPGGVATNFMTAAVALSREALGDAGGAPQSPTSAASVKMNPLSVGQRVLSGIRNNDFYIFTHPEYQPLVAERHRAVEAGFGAAAEAGCSDPQILLDRSRNPAYAS